MSKHCNYALVTNTLNMLIEFAFNGSTTSTFKTAVKV